MVPKDTKIFISIMNSNRDPLLWGPDAEEWKPERWLAPLPQALVDAHVPGIYAHLCVNHMFYMIICFQLKVYAA